MTVSNDTRDRIRAAIVPLGAALGRAGISPNALTVCGFAGTCLGAAAAAAQWWLAAGILVLAFGALDLFDGAVARATGSATKFGAFLDSTLDRTGENLVLAGIAIGAAAGGYLVGTGAAVLAMAFSSAVTYARARAESVGFRGEVGIAPRPERLVVLAVGLILTGALGGVSGGASFAWPEQWFATYDGSWALFFSLALIALVSAVTVAQRILFVQRQSIERKER